MGEARRRRLTGAQHQVEWTKPVLREIKPSDYIANLRQHCLEHADADYDEIELWAFQNSRASRTVVADFTYVFHPEDHRWETPLVEFASRPVWVAWRDEPNPGKHSDQGPLPGHRTEGVVHRPQDVADARRGRGCRAGASGRTRPGRRHRHHARPGHRPLRNRSRHLP